MKEQMFPQMDKTVIEAAEGGLLITQTDSYDVESSVFVPTRYLSQFVIAIEQIATELGA